MTNGRTHLYTTISLASVCLVGGFLPHLLHCLFCKGFFLLQDFFFLVFFFPSPAGPVGPPSREPNEQNTCLNSYRIFILCRAAGGMLCVFWCRAKFPTRTICLQSGPSLSLSGSQGKWARNVATPFFQLQASIAGHFCDTTALKGALRFQSSKPKLPGDFQLRHWYTALLPLSPLAPSRHIYDPQAAAEMAWFVVVLKTYFGILPDKEPSGSVRGVCLEEYRVSLLTKCCFQCRLSASASRSSC